MIYKCSEPDLSTNPSQKSCHLKKNEKTAKNCKKSEKAATFIFFVEINEKTDKNCQKAEKAAKNFNKKWKKLPKIEKITGKATKNE